ncbi:unnamed protein product [Ixodes hexagonus]
MFLLFFFILQVDEHQRLTASEFLARIRRFALRFQQEGLGSGSRVCTCVHNTVDNLAAVLAVIFLGGTLVMAKTVYFPRELSYNIDDSNCDYVLTDEKGVSKFLELCKCLRIKKLFAVGAVPGCINVCPNDNVQQDAFKTHVFPDNAEAVMVIIYTTGTTGLPKGVEISHRAYVSMFYAFKGAGYCNEEDTNLAWNPITHVSAFTTDVFFMCFGTTVVLKEPNLTFQEFVETLSTYKITMLASSPIRMQGIIAVAREKKQHLPTVPKLLLGGSILSDALRTEICNAFSAQSLVNLYALTETCGLVTTTPVGQVTTNNCGLPVTGCRVKVLPLSAFRVLGPYMNGEILVQCNSMMKGYYGRPEATAAALSSDGWLRTGNLGYYDNDGCIYIVERLKDIIKCSGNQVAPAEVEEILLTHDAVKEVVVVGVPSEKHGEAPAACVVLKETIESDPNNILVELKRLVAGQAAVHKHLHGGIMLADNIPKAENGKILRNKVKSRILEWQMSQLLM